MHHIVINKVPNWVSCDEHWTQAKVCSLVWLSYRCLVWWAYREQFMMTPRIFSIRHVNQVMWSDNMILVTFGRVWTNLTYTYFVHVFWVCEPFLNIPWDLYFFPRNLIKPWPLLFPTYNTLFYGCSNIKHEGKAYVVGVVKIEGKSKSPTKVFLTHSVEKNGTPPNKKKEKSIKEKIKRKE